MSPPMFPVNSSLPWRLPSLQRVPPVWFPAFADTTETLRHPELHTGCLWFRLPASAPPMAFVLSLTRSLQTGEGLSGPGAFRCRLPPFRLSYADNTGLLRFPADPFHTSAVFQDPGRIEASSPKRTLRYCPRTQQSEGSSMTMISRPISRLQHPLSTLHEQRRRCPCKTRFRLAG